ncbi:Type II secretion system protein G precursor [compost metagenome]
MEEDMNGLYSQMKSAGFTIVELVVVIAVIGILAAISTISYRAIQDKTNFSIVDSDMKTVKASIEKYYNKNGSYPDTAGVWRYARRDLPTNTYLPELADGYYSGSLPDVMYGSQTTPTDNTYAYRSNKVDYKLIRLAPAGQSTLPTEASGIEPSMVDPNAGRSTRAWGYWTPGGASW